MNDLDRVPVVYKVLSHVLFWSVFRSSYAFPPSTRDVYSRERDDFIFKSQGTEPLQTKEPLGFMSIDLLRMFNKILRDSYDHIHHTQFLASIDTDYTFAEEVDLMFRIFNDINSSKPVLNSSNPLSRTSNHLVDLYTNVQVNQPFIESSSIAANSVRSFISLLKNRTYETTKHDNYDDNYHYEWMGGHVRDLSHNSRLLIGLFSKCNEMEFQSKGKRKHIVWEILLNGYEHYSISFIPMAHSSVLCGGDSEFFKVHPQRSQKIVETSTLSQFKDIKWFGKIDEKDMNPGPSGEPNPRIVHINESSPYFQEMSNLVRFYYVDRYTHLANTMWHSPKKQFEQYLATYNNFGFLLLSIMTLASSTIVAVVTVKGVGTRELLVVVVEAVVVLLFFIVITYVLVIFEIFDDFTVHESIETRMSLFFSQESKELMACM